MTTRLAVAGSVVLLLAAACAATDAAPMDARPGPSPTVSLQPTGPADSQGSTPVFPQVTGASDAAALISQTVLLFDYFFRPMTMEVPAGAEIHLTVINRGNHEHAWVLMEKDYVWEEPFDADDSGHGLVRVTVDVLEQAVLAFTAPSVPGEYNVVCSILGHVEYGMVGKLIVR